MIKKMRRVLFLGLGLIFSGCMVGPDYKPPVNSVPNAWKSNAASQDVALAEQTPSLEWWKELQDPLLDKYIAIACLNNKDVLKAEASIRKARAVRMVAASSLFPHLSADVNATRTHFSKNGPLMVAGGALPQVPFLQNLFNSLFDMTWEIDFFGKTRRKIEAAQASIESSIEELSDALITVMAEIARNYVEVRSFQEKKRLVEENISLLEKNAGLVKERLLAGYDNQLDMERINAELDSAKAQLPDIIAQIYKGIYTVSILTGALPEELFDELIAAKPLPKLPKEIAIGIRSDLLRRRPDVRKAERELAKATAEIGVAVASFYPTVTLGVNLGLQAMHLRNLFQSASKNWQYGGDMSLPIFEGGKLIGNLRATRAQESEAAYTYQKIVLSALEEAESATIAYSKEVATSLEYGKAAAEREKLVSLTSKRFEKGLVDAINLITYKRELIAAELSQLQSDTASLLRLIGLYKALGGGWECVKVREGK